jgi:serine/threonine protein phosphatase PrpC
MSQNAKAFTVQAAALSDRGLNERRPLNEDSFLADGERAIFAVADGVGGAEAGEVASQTAIEVLSEAFRHQTEGADVEDLMELAIQRANASIHQMAQEHVRFSMMATTIVALHVNGNVATIGHVGDSRLYRLTPDGHLHRETQDHSIVEEEVRAGRMTPEQAANHPSKNVISRALGAEDVVEVDMKTMEVEDGTEFVVCTDGITRHVSDNEIRHLLILNDDLNSVCKQLKELCFERGAEDNLTVVIVRVGKRISAHERLEELEPTITPDTQPIFAASSDGNQTMVGAKPNGSLVPPSRIAFPAPETAVPAQATSERLNVEPPATNKGGSSSMRILVVLLALALLAAAFYAGARFKDRLPFSASEVKAPEPTVVAPKPVEEPFAKFERARREVDRDPRAWLASEVTKELVSAGVQNPIDSPNAEFLYLYGRANLLSGNPDEAAKAFEAVIAKTNANAAEPANATIRKEAILAMAAVSLKTFSGRQKALQHYDELTKPPANQTAP